MPTHFDLLKTLFRSASLEMIEYLLTSLKAGLKTGLAVTWGGLDSIPLAFPDPSGVAVMYSGWNKTVSVCGSCTLAILLACVRLAILFLSSLFCPLSVLSQLPLQGVAQDVILSRTHCFLLSDSLLFLCVAKVSCSLHSSEACSPSCLCCGSASLLYFDFLISGVMVYVFLLSVDLLSSWLSDTPCLPCALSLVTTAAVDSSVVG